MQQSMLPANTPTLFVKTWQPGVNVPNQANPPNPANPAPPTVVPHINILLAFFWKKRLCSHFQSKHPNFQWQHGGPKIHFVSQSNLLRAILNDEDRLLKFLGKNFCMMVDGHDTTLCNRHHQVLVGGNLQAGLIYDSCVI